MRINKELEVRLLQAALFCPFCHNKDLAIIDTSIQGNGEYWCVGCTNSDCGASGPASEKPGEAVKKWNEAKR